jgi:hypothetical protein
MRLPVSLIALPPINRTAERMSLSQGETSAAAAGNDTAHSSATSAKSGEIRARKPSCMTKV